MQAPIVIFTYNRLTHLRALIDSLLLNPQTAQTDAFIFSDGGKSASNQARVDGVRRYIHSLTHKHCFRTLTIVERDTNIGLAANVIDGVSDILKRYDSVIVLEDDLVVSPYFLRFMNEALTLYADDERVACINGHTYDLKGYDHDTYFVRHTDSWGWATWRRAWQHFEKDGNQLLKEIESRQLAYSFDFDGSYPFLRMLRRQVEGKVNSWAIRWRASAFLRGQLSLNAGHSLVKHSGTDGSGTHYGIGDLFPTTLFSERPLSMPNQVEETHEARQAIVKLYKRYYTKFNKAWCYLQSVFGQGQRWREQVERGRERLSSSRLIICGIVRDCAAGLRRNRPCIDALTQIAKEAKVILFENDSKDATKQLLTEWMQTNDAVYASMTDTARQATIPTAQEVNGNPFFSHKRISKMARYRQQYVDYIVEHQLQADYVLVVDLDVGHISLDGVLSSFALAHEWDMVSANGVIYSPSAFFRRRFNDTYALVEWGEEEQPQTEESIRAKQYRWAHLDKGMPMQPVYSAFGGLAIYTFEAWQGCRYEVLPNNDNRVEVRCEHYALCRQMHEKGYGRHYVNPAMKVTYQAYLFDRLKAMINK